MYICKCCGHDAFVWLGLLCSPHHHLLSECCGHDSILKVVRRATLPNRMIMDPSTRPQIDTGNSSWCSMRVTQFGVIAVGKTWTTFHDTVDPERLLRQQCPQKWKLHKVWSRKLTKTPRKSQKCKGLNIKLRFHDDILVLAVSIDIFTSLMFFTFINLIFIDCQWFAYHNQWKSKTTNFRLIWCVHQWKQLIVFNVFIGFHLRFVDFHWFTLLRIPKSMTHSTKTLVLIDLCTQINDNRWLSLRFAWCSCDTLGFHWFSWSGPRAIYCFYLFMFDR